MRVALATCSVMPEGAEDDQELARLLGADFAVWDDPGVDWGSYDRVLLRSVWDYSARSEEFLAWCDAVGPARLRNPPELVAFNADKRYLSKLGAPTVPTTFIAPGDPVPALQGEVVIKPNISAGARNTGRFESVSSVEAIELIERIHELGRVALLQPYMPSVDELGETALVFIGGGISHVLGKRAVLRGEGVAPVSAHRLGVAAAMLEEDLVGVARATCAQLALASEIHEHISEQFGTPVFARVDLVAGPDGRPLLLELEVIEPALYLRMAPGSAQRLAQAVLAS